MLTGLVLCRMQHGYQSCVQTVEQKWVSLLVENLTIASKISNSDRSHRFLIVISADFLCFNHNRIGLNRSAGKPTCDYFADKAITTLSDAITSIHVKRTTPFLVVAFNKTPFKFAIDLFPIDT